MARVLAVTARKGGRRKIIRPSNWFLFPFYVPPPPPDNSDCGWEKKILESCPPRSRLNCPCARSKECLRDSCLSPIITSDPAHLSGCEMVLKPPLLSPTKLPGWTFPKFMFHYTPSLGPVILKWNPRTTVKALLTISSSRKVLRCLA